MIFFLFSVVLSHGTLVEWKRKETHLEKSVYFTGLSELPPSTPTNTFYTEPGGSSLIHKWVTAGATYQISHANE